MLEKRGQMRKIWRRFALPHLKSLIKLHQFMHSRLKTPTESERGAMTKAWITTPFTALILLLVFLRFRQDTKFLTSDRSALFVVTAN